MRILSAALAALFCLTLFGATANARERTSAFNLGSSAFGTFGERSRVRRLKQKRARLRRRSRAAQARKVRARRASVRKTRRAAVRKQRRTTVRKARRSKARRTVTRRKVVASRTTATRRKAVKRRKTTKRRKKAASRFARRTVKYNTKQKAGTIVVDTKTRHLYYVLGRGKAIRYGVAVGKEGFAWSGVSRIRRKVEWPTWTPPSEMIKRKPELAKFRAGMPGGPKNPLGARALYLFQGKKDTLYRIHGTNNPGSIGSAASSGCIRMRNDDVAHLYAKVRMGAKVVVR